ncbi:MAG: aminotransferase class I/II-fold pyridoxal phosphate-dependent enzyme [Bacteroidetes bacterium]|nr:aminotransferase class I/II-fold pyridoxal phosphate-dependent enzyme [Bacteroidota bacterium]
MLFLDRNENHFGPAPEVFEVIHNITPEMLTTYSRDFMLGIKSKLSAHIANILGLAEKNVLISYGSEDMLKHIMHCYLLPGEKLMIPEYSWWYYTRVASEVYANTVEYPVHIHRNSFAYDIDEIITLVKKEQPKILLIASPNNPTGNSFSERHLEQLLETFPKLLIVLDEAYIGFSDKRLDGNTRLVSKYANLAVLRTFSKLYALAGMRIAYAVAGEQFRELMMYSNRYLGYNRISEQCALAALKAEQYYHSIQSIIVSERQRYMDLFSVAEGYTAFRSDANFLLVRFPEDHKEQMQRTLKAAGIQIKFYDERLLKNYVRITIGTPAENSQLLNVLMNFLSAYVPLSEITGNSE